MAPADAGPAHLLSAAHRMFQRFPRLARLPVAGLCERPTPVQSLDVLSRDLRCEMLSIKRDDRTAVELGGNKVRKLDFQLGAALAARATAVVTAGAASSNHVVATAAHARRLGLRTVALVVPQTASGNVRRNLLRAHAAGANLVAYPAGTSMHSTSSAVRAQMESLRGEGWDPYFVPFAGMGTLGALGYVSAAFELAEDVAAGRLPEPDSIYLALGSMGTALGLAIGLRAAGLRSRVIAVRAVNQRSASTERLRAEGQATIEYLHQMEDSFPAQSAAELELELRGGPLDTEYGVATEAGLVAARTLYDAHGIVLDSTYTAKAFSVLLQDARSGAAGRFPLYWHTAAGSSSADDEQLPAEFQCLPEAFHALYTAEEDPIDREFAALRKRARA